MKISLTIYIDPLRLRPEHKLNEVHLRISESFAKILDDENLVEINAFDLSVDYDQDDPKVPATAAYDWFKRFNKMSREKRRSQK